MTRDHYRKKDVRAHARATGRTYLKAATGSAAALRDGLVAGFRAAGWPVEIEHHPQATGLRLYAGPVTLSVERDDDGPRGFSGDEHPDDPDVFDLTAPLRVVMWAPLVVDYSEELGRVGGVDAHEIAAPTAAAQVIAEIDRVLAHARGRDVREMPADSECAICGDRYPGTALFEPSPAPVAVCPVCAFDGDLLDADPAVLAFALDRAFTTDLSLPAGWAAVQALLGCLGGTGFPAWLSRVWKAASPVLEPLEMWHTPGATWVWLPAPEHRPAVLAEAGCGARLDHLVTTIDRAHPDLRAATRAHRAEILGEEFDADGEFDDATLDRFWPAAIAYAVSLLTQESERPGHREPWHVLESFELEEWIEELDADLDGYDVQSVLGAAVPVIVAALAPDHEPI